MNGEDVKELVAEHNQELTFDKLLDLHEEQQEEETEEILSEEEEAWEDVRLKKL